ncbi:MAG: hypothetical protein GWO24_08565, partial [Akkermansiaceae bacterium]|nr:hypothetical protein [Akkermansiaceae bacterium]
AARRAAGKAEREKGKDSSAYAKAQTALHQADAAYEKTRRWAESEFSRLRKDIERIHANNGRYRLIMRTA